MPVRHSASVRYPSKGMNKISLSRACLSAGDNISKTLSYFGGCEAEFIIDWTICNVWSNFALTWHWWLVSVLGIGDCDFDSSVVCFDLSHDESELNSISSSWVSPISTIVELTSLTSVKNLLNSRLLNNHHPVQYIWRAPGPARPRPRPSPSPPIPTLCTQYLCHSRPQYFKEGKRSWVSSPDLKQNMRGAVLWVN